MRTKINKVQSDAYQIIFKKIAPQLYNSILIIDAVRHKLPLNIFYLCPNRAVWYDLFGELK